MEGNSNQSSSSWAQACWDTDNYENVDTNLRYNFSQGPSPSDRGTYFGGWDNLTVDFTLGFDEGWSESWFETYGDGAYGNSRTAVWPTSSYVFTLYYNFIPVIPVE